MKVLIVDDNPDLAENISEYLEAEGCTTDFAYRGGAALALIQQDSFDVIILDVMMPGKTGFDVCQTAREQYHCTTPILFLTARDTLEDKICGFSAGCDDYLVKPFSLRELFFRVKALAKRGNRQDIGRLTIGELQIDYHARTAYRGTQLLKLNKIEFEILALLMKKYPHIVTKQTIEYALWQDEAPNSDPLRTHIYHLRNLVDKPFATKLIETIHGKGYKINPQSSEHSD